MKKYKTEMCKNFEIKGFCKWGNKCCFAHGEHELRAKNHLNDKYKSKICKHYHRHGFCPYGLRCQYFHIKDSYDEFLMAFTEKLQLKKKESTLSSDVVMLMKQLTQL
jgi:butyrate response factor